MCNSVKCQEFVLLTPVLVILEHGSRVIGVQRRTQTKGSPCPFLFHDLSILHCLPLQVEKVGSPNRPPDPSLKRFTDRQIDKLTNSCK